MTALTPLHLQVIDELAEKLVADYLTEQAAAQQDDGPERAERVPLPPLDQAA